MIGVVKLVIGILYLLCILYALLSWKIARKMTFTLSLVLFSLGMITLFIGEIFNYILIQWVALLLITTTFLFYTNKLNKEYTFSIPPLHEKIIMKYFR